LKSQSTPDGWPHGYQVTMHWTEERFTSRVNGN